MRNRLLSITFFLIDVLAAGAQPTWLQASVPDTAYTLDLSATRADVLLCRRYYQGNARLFRSADLANSWSRITNGSVLANRPASCLLISPSVTVYVSFPFQGVLRSTDGGSSWMLVNNSRQFSQMIFNPSVGTLLGVENSTLYTSIDNGST